MGTSGTAVAVPASSESSPQSSTVAAAASDEDVCKVGSLMPKSGERPAVVGPDDARTTGTGGPATRVVATEEAAGSVLAPCTSVAAAAVLGPVLSAGTGAAMLAVLPVLAGMAAAVGAAASLPSMDCALVTDAGALFLFITKFTPTVT